MKKVINFVKGKRDDKKDKVISSNICVEITNPLGQKVPSEDEHILGLQSGYGYDIDINGRDKSMTKLHKGAWQGNLDKVKLYLKKFDINIVDELNRTPLHLAAAQGHTSIVCFLLNNKAIPDISDSDGMTPFLKAVECGVKECVSVLVERGVNLSATDNNGNTALHITAKQGFFNIMSMLLKNGANCDAANNAGEMALHIATEQEHQDLVEVLLQAGAHANVVDRDNRTPLMLAARVGQVSLVSLLLKHGAQLDACDNNGWTAEDYAMIGGHEQLVHELKVPQDIQNVPISDIEEAKAEPSLNESNDDVLQEFKTEPGECQTPKEESENIKLSVKSPPYNILAMEEEAQDSPRSCVTPPPLNPPRSWEIIQAGMIDQTQVRRRSLMALGTLESHRESFVENGNGHEASVDTTMDPPKPSFLVEADVVRGDSDTEWDSDDSLPLDRSLPPPPDFPDSSLESNLPLPDFTITPDSSLPHIPELIITPDRRSRITLERTPSLDLTDSEMLDNNKMSVEGTLGKEGTFKGSEEIWEFNRVVQVIDNANKTDDSIPSPIINDTGQIKDNNIIKNGQINGLQDIESEVIEVQNCSQNKIKVGGVRESFSLDDLDECVSKSKDIESSQSFDRLNSEDSEALDTSEIVEFTQSLDSLDEESLVSTVVKKNAFHESHSLELLDDSKKHARHHTRNKSMSVSSYHWSKSVDVLNKPCKGDGLSLDRQRIDAQLQCYDEALRELAEEQKVKQELLNRALQSSTNLNLKQSLSCDVVESKVSVIPKASTCQKECFSTSSHLYRNSFDGSNCSLPPKDNYKDVNKSNTIEVLNLKSIFKENPNIFGENSLPQILDLNQDCVFISEKCLPPSGGTLVSKQTSCKQRSNSASSRPKRRSFEGKQKFYNSLELPTRKKGQVSSSKSCVNSNKSYIVANMPEVQNGVKCFANSNQNFQTLSHESPKPPPRVKKSLKKEKSDGELRNKSDTREETKKRVGRSISLYMEHINIDEPSKKQIVDNKDLCLCEKSESDSDWSERPVHNKRKQFSTMRGVVADSEDSNEEDPPFWLSSGKDGCFSRQDTVIYNEHANGINGMKKDIDGEKSKEEGNEEVTSSSDSGSASISHSDATPSEQFVLKGHQSLLKEHLKQATEEKAHLEEMTARLKEQAERLQYDLADANQSLVARDDKLLILQEELSRLSSKYSNTLDELNSLKQRLTTAEIELKHLRELTRINMERENKKPDFNTQHLMKQLHESNKVKNRMVFEKETLTAQHLMDIKKLQQDTIHWKNLYEDAVSKLEQIEGLCDPCLIENNQHLDRVRSAFKKFRDEKNSGRCKLKDTSDSNCLESKNTNLEPCQGDAEDKTAVCCLNDTNIDNQVATLQLQLQQEKSKRSALENQVQKMLLELQTKYDLEVELENLNGRLEKEFVPRVELEQLRANQESVIARIRQQALIESETKLNAKLTEINQILQIQLQEQTQKEKQRELVEIQMKQEFENTRQKLLLELSRVQAALKAKESEERALREQCEALARETEKAQDRKRRQLIEKSYSVNLVDTRREKELTVKQSVIPPPPPPPPLATTPLDVNRFSANSLRQQLELSISKNRGCSRSVLSSATYLAQTLSAVNLWPLSHFSKMPVPIWLVAVFVTLTSCASGIGSLTAAEEDPSSLQYIHAFFRHGIRSPLYKPFPNDPNKSKYHEYFPGPRGQLTKVGKQVMYNVGKKLKERYGKFLGDFSDEKVHISSTDTSRTIMTALTMMAGLFPPSKPILEDLKWQPVPVWQDSRDFDKAYLYNDEHFPKLAIEECPKYGALIKRGCDKVDHPDKTKGRHKFYKLLKNYTGQMDLNSLTTHYHIWDTLQFESLNGLPLPSWSSTPQPDFNNKPLYPDIMEPIMVEWFKDTQYLNNNTEMLHFYSGPLLNTVHKHMGKKIKSPRSHEIMRLHATHDTTLFVFLWAFGLREPAVVGPGDGVIFELHKINETEIVKVLYYDTNHDHQVTELALPFCPAPCLFHQFIRSRPGLTPEQWRRKCQN